MGTKNHSGKFIFLMVIFFCCLLLGCNESDSDSDKSKSIDTESTWYRDSDGDGYGDPSVSVTQEDQPAGYVADNSDCADYDADIFPGAIEVCDGKDNNCDGNVDENACGPDSQKISGRIANISEARLYITDESYLQLVFYPADGQLVFSNDARGRRIYTSDLARVDVPADGLFLFETTGLVSGEYIVAAQALTPYDPESEAMPILADEDDQPVVFSVSADNAQVLGIDLGNARLPVPEVGVTLLQTPQQSKLSTPSGVSATDGVYEDKIRVTWNASAGATSYEIYRANSFAGQKIKIGTTNATFYDDMALPCGTDYYYWVRAVNASGASDLFYSDLGFARCPLSESQRGDGEEGGEAVDESGETIEELEDKPVTLDTPAGIEASDGEYPDKIRITWKAVPSATSYDIYRTYRDCCGLKIKIGSSNNTVHDDFDVIFGDYYYWIKANNMSGTSEFSFPDGGHIMTRPFSPAGVRASDGTYLNKVLITWDKAPTANYNYNSPCCPPLSDKTPIVSSYEIYRGRWRTDTKILVGTSTTNQFYDTDLECSTCRPDTFVYWVKAVNAAGVSNFSSEDTGFVYQTPCDPTGVKATDGRANCVWITWDCDNGGLCNTPTGVKRYEIYRADSADGEKIKICTVDPPCCGSYRDLTTTCPNIYYYWVKAIDAKGYTSCTFGDYDTGYCVSE